MAPPDGLLQSSVGGEYRATIRSDLTESLAPNPMLLNTIRGGTADGSAKTIDGGADWQPGNETLTGMIPGFLGVNPLNPVIVYSCFTKGFGLLAGGEAW